MLQNAKNTTRNHSQDAISGIRLSTHHLCRIDGAHLVVPRRRRIDPPDNARLVEGVSGDANVVVALEHRLDVADFQRRVVPQLGKAAGRHDDVVDELVGEFEEGLGKTRRLET